MSQASTRPHQTHDFVRGGTLSLGERALVLGDDPVVVGRDPNAHVVIDGDPEVSLRHCELRATRRGVRIRDLDSTNGVHVGGLLVTDACLTERTDVRIGKTTFSVVPDAKRRVELGFDDHFGEVIGATAEMRRVHSILGRVAATPLSLLVTGETGTGKEVVARSIHAASERAKGPFVVVDCGSIPAGLAESILFGHEKGAFTGASERRKGALAEAHGGTLFLDELGELPLELQPKLLRALAERQVKRVGGSQYEPVDVRVLAATRRELDAEMNAGRFRSDLYFRIAQIRVELPPLRQRRDDIPLLVAAMAEQRSKRAEGEAVLGWLTERFAAYDWPGNVRELVNVVEVALALANNPEALDEVLPLARMEHAAHGSAARSAFTEAKRVAVGRFEHDYFAGLIQATSHNVSEMARIAGMERHHVRAYLRKLGLQRSQ